MRVRGAIFSAICATYLIVACATGGDDTATEGGSAGDAPGMTNDAKQDELPTGFDSTPEDDNFVPPDDSSAPFDSAPGDSFIPPTDSFVPPKDSGISDTKPPPMDVITTTPKCSLLSFKYITEFEILGESAVPCSLGCTSTQCCWHGTTPPVCLPK